MCEGGFERGVAADGRGESRLGTMIRNSVFILKKLREITEGFKQRRDVMRSAF